MIDGVLRIHTDGGLIGEVSGFGFREGLMVKTFGQYLIGKNALERERIYNDLKLMTRAFGRLGMGTVDIALWDIAGKYYDQPIYKLLGGYRKKLPCYASTMNGAENGGLSTPESYGDFAQQCLELGYRGFKIHPWPIAPIEKHIKAIDILGKRVGGKMDLMIDPFCCCYETFGEAYKVCKACDEAGFFWIEDPCPDGGGSDYTHKMLKSLIKTPFLMGEQVRGVENKANLLTAEATDFIRGNVEQEGITGSIKLAHIAEGFGADIEYHGCSPATRHVMAATKNSNYYEIYWVHPDVPAMQRPIYKGNYRDGLYGIDKDGCVDIPEDPGLGVELDWDLIKNHTLDSFKME